VCPDHENEPITSFCKKCKCYLCCICQIDHIDHAKGNLQNASEPSLFKNFSEFSPVNAFESIDDLYQALNDYRIFALFNPNDTDGHSAIKRIENKIESKNDK
jgi:hypothetical protein